MSNEELEDPEFYEDSDDDDESEFNCWSCPSCGHTQVQKPSFGGQCPKCMCHMEEEYF